MMERPEGCEDKDVDRAPEILTVDEVTLDGGAIDFRERNGVVSGNVYRGGVVRGDGDVVVKGNVSGVPQSRCSFSVEGALEIEQGAAFASIKAHHIIVKGDVDGCSLVSDTGIEIHGDLSDSQASVGNRTYEIKLLNQVRVERKQIELKLDELRIRTGSAARKFLRDYPQVDLKMGNILVPLRRELKVDLKQFYLVLKTSDSEKIDQALEEFYLRMVVRTLTRSNRYYISQNPSRHKVFLRLIEELRNHILKVREVDKLETQAQELERKVDPLLNVLQHAEGDVLHVRGDVAPGISVQFLELTGRQEPGEAAFQIDQVLTEARVVDADGKKSLDIVAGGAKKQEISLPRTQLRNGFFCLRDGLVEWHTDS